MSKDIVDGYLKTAAVIKSCKTHPQLKTATNYMKLWQKTLPKALEDDLPQRIETLFFKRLREIQCENEKFGLAEEKE